MLGGFTPSGRQSDALWSFDNERAMPESRTPKAVAFETDFYAVDVPGQPPDLIESYFGKVETRAAKIIRKMIADRVVPAGDDFGHLMFFLALMFVRAPAFRKLVMGFIEESMHLAVKIAASSPENYEAAIRGMPADKQRPTFEMMQKWASEDEFVKIANESAMHAQLTMLGLKRGGPQLLGQRNWSLLFAASDDVQFVCSDNPISLVASKSAAMPYIARGIAYPETDFILPIHRTAALLGRFEGRSEVHVVDDAVVACVNGRTVESALRYVYSPAPEFYVLDADRTLVPGSARWLRPSPNSEPA
jgi:hypothetical protein